MEGWLNARQISFVESGKRSILSEVERNRAALVGDPKGNDFVLGVYRWAASIDERIARYDAEGETSHVDMRTLFRAGARVALVARLDNNKGERGLAAVLPDHATSTRLPLVHPVAHATFAEEEAAPDGWEVLLDPSGRKCYRNLETNQLQASVWRACVCVCVITRACECACVVCAACANSVLIYTQLP